MRSVRYGWAMVPVGVGRQYMSDLMSGRKGISGRVAKALGFKKRVVFEPISKR